MCTAQKNTVILCHTQSLSGGVMDAARLILDYIKTLIWPVILLVMLLSYEDEVMGLLQSREIDAFGLKIGKRIEDISRNYETEIAELKEGIKNAGDNPDLIRKIESIDKNIKKELSLVQQQSEKTLPPEASLPKSQKAIVASHERSGFEALLNGEVEQAIAHFDKATTLWPDYHNVSEIEKLLRNQRNSLLETGASNQQYPENWQRVFKQILTQYSWGMPSDLRSEFARATGK